MCVCVRACVGTYVYVCMCVCVCVYVYGAHTKKKPTQSQAKNRPIVVNNIIPEEELREKKRANSIVSKL